MSINRKELVTRHNPVIGSFNPWAPLSVGNGEFAYTADFTGLQTFAEEFSAIPLCTMSQWGWHSAPFSRERLGCDLTDLEFEHYDTYGRVVGYPTSSAGQEEVYNWLRMNPHRFHLGRIGLELTKENGEDAALEDIEGTKQTLDLWRGVLSSRFLCTGAEVSTTTCCHPHRDILAITVRSKLVSSGQLRVKIEFPYGSGNITGADWQSGHQHTTEILDEGPGGATFVRSIDSTRYFLQVAWNPGAKLVRTGAHSFVLGSTGSGFLQLVCAFLPERPSREALPTFDQVLQASEGHWEEFWEQGGALELAESKDQRALELERRVVLSQYLTAIQCAGSLPPQETGLTCNSWYGKHHLEMHFWHGAHFALWGRTHLLKRSLSWYRTIVPRARQTARSQGYHGVRWPKMVGFDGRESPSPIGPLLIWQQPHSLYFAELCYRAKPTRETLEFFRDLVTETAEFMASFAVFDQQHERYVLGPPLIPAQENHAPGETLNPAFELEYWSFGLRVANTWRKRLGLVPDKRWQEIAAKLAPLPVQQGTYLAQERCPATFSEFNYDHPSMVAALGVLPGDLVDRRNMSRTLDRVCEEWLFEEMWGWDFSMLAMTAARLNRPELAMDLLMCQSPKNTYLPNGHNRQGEREDLPLYLPGNGGLLLAVAMMAAGWDGHGELEPPGFPENGKWNVKHEGLLALP